MNGFCLAAVEVCFERRDEGPNTSECLGLALEEIHELVARVIIDKYECIFETSDHARDERADEVTVDEATRVGGPVDVLSLVRGLSGIGFDTVRTGGASMMTNFGWDVRGKKWYASNDAW